VYPVGCSDDALIYGVLASGVSRLEFPNAAVNPEHAEA
jgi:hypothetical protein